MISSAVYSHRGTIAKSSVGPGSGGGDVDDVLKRLGNVEAGVTDLKTQCARIEAVIPTLATAESVSKIEAIIPTLATAESISRIEAVIPTLATAESVSRIEAIIPHLATKDDVTGVKVQLAVLESTIIKWMIATMLSSTALAFSVAKFIR